MKDLKRGLESYSVSLRDLLGCCQATNESVDYVTERSLELG